LNKLTVGKYFPDNTQRYLKYEDKNRHMKHTFSVTLMLVVIFLFAQIAGLAVVNSYIDHSASAEEGKAVFGELPYDIDRPDVAEGSSFWYIFIAILIGTGIIFLIIKFRRKVNVIGWWIFLVAVWLDLLAVLLSSIDSIAFTIVRVVIDIVLIVILIKLRKSFDLWKVWFLLAVLLTLAVSFAAFIPEYIAMALALGLALWKVFRPNMYIHNATEIFIYGGLAAIFVPIMNLFAAFMLLGLISIYDMFAVWKSKHMIEMAQFQTESKLFAGLSISYSMPVKISDKKPKGMQPISPDAKTAILGGGDIGFPLLFAGVVMKGLMLTESLTVGFLKSMIIPVFAAIALFILLMYGKEDQFYPAMPFISAGCLVGYFVVLIV